MESEFNEVYPQGEVEHITPVYDETALESIVAVYKSVQRQLEDLVDDYTSKLRRGKNFKPVEVLSTSTEKSCHMHWRASLSCQFK